MIAFIATRLLCGLVFTLDPCGNNHLYTPATLKSPVYHSFYSIDCNWIISATNGSRILLTFSYFSSQSQSRCDYNYLDVYDGGSSYAQKLGRYCGDESKLSLTSSGSHLFIAFHSDGIIPKFFLNFSNTVGKFYLQI
ncbi:tolloid-like protein 1 [Dendronephthya gigantea]|uniref:tolloid-like protein 1 n=1 Tax=Dendronephthya gigantea TaxID=151771 RepID=UPI00106960A2|nr:tolloid-like protein 1 [Dendronephthya gigantea]XP_028390752.1 tolloid-like protein 1 [Dendronephthya gigantea]